MIAYDFDGTLVRNFVEKMLLNILKENINQTTKIKVVSFAPILMFLKQLLKLNTIIKSSKLNKILVKVAFTILSNIFAKIPREKLEKIVIETFEATKTPIFYELIENQKKEKVIIISSNFEEIIAIIIKKYGLKVEVIANRFNKIFICNGKDKAKILEELEVELLISDPIGCELNSIENKNIKVKNVKLLKLT
jgi:phosphoserine phosphatase